MEEDKNKSIQYTLIKPGVKVSSAAIYYQEIWGDRWQYETWIFRNDGIESKMAIHGSSSHFPNERLENISKKFHRRVVRLFFKR